MKLTRTLMLFLAVCLPTSWTIAHAEDAPPAGDMKDMKPKKKGKKKKAEGGDMKKEEAPK
jgi:hypothetical protein